MLLKSVRKKSFVLYRNFVLLLCLFMITGLFAANASAHDSWKFMYYAPDGTPATPIPGFWNGVQGDTWPTNDTQQVDWIPGYITDSYRPNMGFGLRYSKSGTHPIYSGQVTYVNHGGTLNRFLRKTPVRAETDVWGDIWRPLNNGEPVFWLYDKYAPGLVKLNSCFVTAPGNNTFATTDPNCEGIGVFVEELGYVMPSLNPAYGDGLEVDIIGVGMGNKYSGSSSASLSIPNPGNVEFIIAQVVTKYDNGSLVEITTSEGDICQITNSILNAKARYYEARIKPTSSITAKITDMEGSHARSFFAYVFRNTGTNSATTGKLPRSCAWGGSTESYCTTERSETLTIPPASSPRNVEVTFAISELDNDNRLVILKAEAGNVTRVKDDNKVSNMGDQAHIITLLLPDVPGNVTQVKTTVISPPPKDVGDSVYWCGVNVKAEGDPPKTAIDIQKHVSVDNKKTWHDADNPTGPLAIAGSDVYFKYIITNTGDTGLSDLTLSDSKFSINNCKLPNYLAPGASFSNCFAGPFPAVVGQHTNTATVTGKYSGKIVRDSDNANYIGKKAEIDIEKNVSVGNLSDWEDADNPTGPSASLGDDVYFRFRVTNTGGVTLSNITLSDSDFNLNNCSIPPSLKANGFFDCIVSTTATNVGQHTNTATATGDYGQLTVSDQDDANYITTANPAIDIEKYVSDDPDQINWTDADIPTGLDVMAGIEIWFKFEVTNTSDVPLTGISVNDNIFGPVTCENIPTTLYPKSSFNCIIASTAVRGQHTNTATVTGYYGVSPVTDKDDANYYGRSPAIDIEKEVSADGKVTWHDADNPKGPEAEPGSEVYFRFTITNAGDIKLTDITLTDSDFDVTSCTMPASLAPGESFECEVSSVAVEGQHTNTAMTTGRFRQITVSDADDANYEGIPLVPSIRIKKYISADNKDSWDDADEPAGPDVEAGNDVFFRFVVTNDGKTLLTGITLDDDKIDISSCSVPESLAPGESFECIIAQAAVAGQHLNTATAKGTYQETTVEDNDPAHYHGCSPEIDLVYLVDFSGSMLWHDFEGTERYEAAKHAIIAMNKQMTEHGGASRGALITFADDQAGVQVGFTSNFDEIDTKLNEVGPVSGSMTPTASGISETADYLKNNLDPDHLPVVIFITDGVPNADLAKNKYNNYLQDIKDITLYDKDGKFLDSDEVRQMGTSYSQYGTKGGAPWADVMDQIREMKNAISDAVIYGVAVQGQESFKEDLVEYAAHVSGGKSFSTANVNELQDSLTEILRDSTCFDLPSVLLKKYVSVDNSDTWKDADEPGGPDVKAGDDVYYKLKITNNGNEPLTNIHLSDTMHDIDNCNVPGTLGSGEFFECMTGPFTAVEGPHTNTATVTANNSQSLVSDSDDANYTGIQYSPPRPPENLEAKMEANGVKLSWVPVSDEHIRGYNVYRSLPDGAPALITQEVVAGSYYLDKSGDLVPGITYYYAVKSINIFGNESCLSNMVSVIFGNKTRLVIPDVRACAGDSVSISLTLENQDSKGIQSAYAVIGFDTDIIKVTKVASAGIFAGNYLFDKKIDNENGLIIIAFAAKTDSYVTESGNMAEIRVQISEYADMGETELEFAEAEINDMPGSAKDGKIECPPEKYNISGNVGYFKNRGPVRNVSLTLEGTGYYSTVTNSQGNYLFPDIPPGDYTSVPSKTDDIENGLSAFDASKILRYVVKKGQFDCYQMIAADVNKDNRITATDASEVAICSGKRDVGLEYCMNDGCVNWVFTVPMTDCDDWPPITEYLSERTYDPLDKERTKQDFAAILLGDVTKNWAEKQNRGRRARSKILRSESEISAIPGSSLTIPIVLDQETDIQAIDIVIQFDENLLDPTGVTLIGGILEDWEDNLQVITEAEGQTAVKIFSSDEVTGTGDVAFISFKVAGPVGSTSVLSFTKFEVNESPVPGGFSVDDTVTTRVKVRTAKPVPGDVNGDRIVDIRDAILSLKVLSGADTGNIPVYPAADVNGDRIIGIHEVIYGLQIIPGIRGEAAI